MRVAGKQLSVISSQFSVTSQRDGKPLRHTFVYFAFTEYSLLSTDYLLQSPIFHQARIERRATSHIGKPLRSKGVNADAVGHEL
jgi:hypothetical protein